MSAAARDLLTTPARCVSCVPGPYCIATGHAYPGTGADEQTLAESVGVPAPTPSTGPGYRLVVADGGVFAYGDAGFFGSGGGTALAKPIVGISSTPDGGGYWLVAADGGVFAYGDAIFSGSAGSMALNKPVVGMAA